MLPPDVSLTVDLAAWDPQLDRRYHPCVPPRHSLSLNILAPLPDSYQYTIYAAMDVEAMDAEREHLAAAVGSAVNARTPVELA